MSDGRDWVSCSDEELRNAWSAMVRDHEKTPRRTIDALRRECKRRRRELRDRIRAHLTNIDWQAEPTIERLRSALNALTGQ